MKTHPVTHPEQITQVYAQHADKFIMAAQNSLIMNLLRIITPEEIADIATKHNGGKFLSLTALVDERVERNIHRDFTPTNAIDDIHDEHASYTEKVEAAKILPFASPLKANKHEFIPFEKEGAEKIDLRSRLTVHIKHTSQAINYEDEEVVEKHEPVVHAEDENMSSFILVEKERLKQSQKSLKKKEIIRLYQKNSTIDLEQIKTSNKTAADSGEAGVLVNKKQY